MKGKTFVVAEPLSPKRSLSRCSPLRPAPRLLSTLRTLGDREDQEVQQQEDALSREVQDEDALRERRDLEEEGGDAQRRRNHEGTKERREGE